MGFGFSPVGLFLAVAFSLTACGDATSPVSIKVLYAVGGKGDGAWNDAAYLGLLRYHERTGRSFTEGVPTDRADATSIFHKWLDADVGEGRSLLVLLNHDADALLASVDCELRGHQVLHFAKAVPDCFGSRAVEFRTFEPAFLAGAASMALSPRRAGAALGGRNTPAIAEIVAGFRAGVEYAGGTWVDTYYIPAGKDGFNLPDEGRLRGNRLYRRADVILAAAGATLTGVLEAAREQPDRYVVASDTDQAARGPSVVAGSVVRRLEEILPAAMERAVDAFEVTGTEVHDLQGWGTDFVPNPALADWMGSNMTVAQQPAHAAALEWERGQ